MSTFRAMHSHTFLNPHQHENERRLWWVIGLTIATMLAEIIAGQIFGSMALFADGWHMSTHAGALLIAVLAYGYARRHADNTRFSFGTGKVGDLAGFASAVVLALVALFIAAESLMRLANPVTIDVKEAVLVAVIGLIVNLISARLLNGGHHHHDHKHSHEHHHVHDHQQDNNMQSAYIHVLADALTSVLAIAALLLGKSLGWYWADPLMGLVGAAVIAKWSWNLICDSGSVLLDASRTGVALQQQICTVLADKGMIRDVHAWQIGPGHYAAIVSLIPYAAQTRESCLNALSTLPELSHITVEILPADAV